MDSRLPGGDDERPAVPRLLPLALLAPTYQNRLRTIGRELDVNGYRSIISIQVDGGFIVRAVNRHRREMELLEFPDADFPERMIAATEARGDGERPESPSTLAPTGYEDMLRAIGRRLDRTSARNVVIAEGQTALLVTGQRATADGGVEAFETILDVIAITELLDESFRLRTSEERTDERKS
jgi:hypothetical protein